MDSTLKSPTLGHCKISLSNYVFPTIHDSDIQLLIEKELGVAPNMLFIVLSRINVCPLSIELFVVLSSLPIPLDMRQTVRDSN